MTNNGAAHEHGQDARHAPGFEALLAEYVEELNLQGFVDPERIAKEHPDLASALLEGLKTYIALQEEGPPHEPLGTLGDYTLRRQIGRGGMGVVYDAWQNSLDRQVALKVLPAGVAADDKSFHRFMREAKTAAKLNHQNIVGVYGMGVEANTPYYAMEFVEGETLAQIVSKLRTSAPGVPTPFGPSAEDIGFYSAVARAFAEVADGLQHAHSKGVIHRDIKPSNLILDQEGHLRILDFGLARLEGQESITFSGDVVGTVQYMSPEQAQVKKIAVDHRTDIYSLGATMYEVLTGRPPFKGRDHHDTLTQIIARNAEPLRKLNARVPRDLETIVLKCMRKDPADRYGTAEALGQDLRRFARGDAIEARPQTRLEMAAAGIWRHRKIACAGAAALAFVVLGLATSTILITRAHGTAVREREEAMRQRDARSRDLYRSDMRRALEDWDSGNIYRFEQLLDRHLPGADEKDLCGWEWYYLDSLRRQALRSIDVGGGGVLWVDWHPDGRRVATGSLDGAVAVWDTTTGKRETEFRVAVPPASVVAWSPDGLRLGALSRDCTLQVWDIAAGTELYKTHTEAGTQFDPASVAGWTPLSIAGAWSPDGKFFAATLGDPNRREGVILIVYDGADGRVVRTLEVQGAGMMPQLSWSPNGAYLAGALREGEVVVWDAATWIEHKRFRASDTGWLYSIAWSPDAGRLAAGNLDGQIGIWATDTWVRADVLEEGTGYILSMAWSPDGKRLAHCGFESTFRVRDLSKTAHPIAYRGHTQWARTARWSPDGTRLASASLDGTVKLWDSMGSDQSHVLECGHPAAISADGRWLAAPTIPQGRTLRIYDLSTMEPVGNFECENNAECLAFSPDGDLLAVAMWSDCVGVWQWQKGVQIHAFAHEAPHSGWMWATASWSADGRWLATGHSDGTLLVWDRATWKVARELRAHAQRVASVVWSPGGELLATTSPDQEIKVWDTSTWQVVWRLLRSPSPLGTEPSRQNILAWSPDGSRLAAGSGGILPGVSVFELSTGQELLRVPVSSLSVAWSPDGKRLATCYSSTTVMLLDPATGDELLALRGTANSILSLVWHPDGKRLMAADLAVGVRIWDSEAERR